MAGCEAGREQAGTEVGDRGRAASGSLSVPGLSEWSQGNPQA